MYQEIVKNIWVVNNSNPFDNNAYIVIHNNKCVVIDPSSYDKEIIQFIEDKKLKLLGIVLTHAHFDHFGASNNLANKYKVKIYVYKKEKPTFDMLDMSLESWFPVSDLDWNNIKFFESNELKFDDIKFKVLFTPGHTKGGIVLIYDNVFFTGDTLFVDSVGRTDFPGGDMQTLMDSVYKLTKIMKDDDYLLCGHGKVYPQYKTVKQINPYVRHTLSR